MQALITGTLVVEDYCEVCGQRGHRQYECPARNKTFKAANVKCAICGEMSHPTRDCPQREVSLLPASSVLWLHVGTAVVFITTHYQISLIAVHH